MTDIAAFDFDGTLTEGGSVFAFLATLVGQMKVTKASLALAPRLAHAALAGGTVADSTKERLFVRVLAGVDLETLETVSAAFAAQHLAEHLRPEVHHRFQWHKERGDRIAIVSASLDCYVTEASRILGADHAIATHLQVDDGRLTGHYEGRNCRGEEKLRRLTQWTDQLDLPGAHLWAYGNSRGDLRMLHAADVGINVGRLGKFGKLRSYPALRAQQTSAD